MGGRNPIKKLISSLEETGINPKQVELKSVSSTERGDWGDNPPEAVSYSLGRIRAKTLPYAVTSPLLASVPTSLAFSVHKTHLRK